MLVADCVPVLLADPDAGVVGVAHAGRKGMAGRRRPAAVADAMRDLGATRIVARLGPSVCARCYQVPLELREQVGGRAPETRSLDRRRAAGARRRAPGCWPSWPRAGVDVTTAAPAAPPRTPRLYSYRRDGAHRPVRRRCRAGRAGERRAQRAELAAALAAVRGRIDRGLRRRRPRRATTSR